MPNIRVLIRNAPKMLRDILEQAIVSQPDMEVIPEPVTRPLPVEDVSPDVVVVDVNEADSGEGARALLSRWPDSHVLTIVARGHMVRKYELAPRRVDLGEMSPDQLIHAIRSAALAEGRSS